MLRLVVILPLALAAFVIGMGVYLVVDNGGSLPPAVHIDQPIDRNGREIFQHHNNGGGTVKFAVHRVSNHV